MNIRQNKNYPTVLKGIALEIRSNQIQSLGLGRNGIIKHWVQNAKEVVKNFTGDDEKDLKEDINHIIDKIMGIEFN